MVCCERLDLALSAVRIVLVNFVIWRTENQLLKINGGWTSPLEL